MSDKNNDNTRLSPYRGKLSPKDVSRGMKCAIDNARRLANDARILFDAESYPSSCALAILSIEEIGKLSILRQISLSSDNKSVKAMWCEYCSHTDKNYMWLFFAMASSGAIKLEDFRSLFNKSNSHLLNNIKQICLYSGCYGKKNWSNPKEVIDKDLSGFLLKTAELLTRSNVRYPSTREIQLWIEFMQPVWNSDYESQASALTKWHQSLIDEGLITDKNNTIEDFVKR